MNNKASKASPEEITKDVCEILEKIITTNLTRFKEEGTFKVRPGYGYDKFYLDRVDGSYDMSLQGLIHYILHDDGHYKKFLSKKQLQDVDEVIKESPESIYSPDDDDEAYEEIQSDYLDFIYANSIQFVANQLIQKGFDVEETFSDYM